MKEYGIRIRNCAGTTIYMLSKPCRSREEAFEAAKQAFAWFAKDPHKEWIVEGGPV